MGTHNPIFLLDIEDLHIEAVLGGGFWGNFQLALDIHSHTYFELMLCCNNGFSLALNDGSVLPMGTNDVCLIPPGVYHRSCDPSPSAKKMAIRFYCTRNLNPGNVFNTFTAAMASRSSLVHLGQQQELMRLTVLLRRELREDRLACNPCVQALLTQLFVQLLRILCKDIPVQTSTRKPPVELAGRRLAIEEFFNSRHAEPITEVDLAQHLHISKRQLSRVLQQLYGSSFRKLLIDIRLSHAVQLLTTTELNAEEIASRVGYNSVSGFYEAFRKRYGISAGSYKQHLFR